MRAFDVYSVILPENMNTLKDKIIDIGAQIEGKKKVIMKTIQEIRSVCNFYFHIQKGSQLTQTEEILYLLGKEKKIQGIIDSVGTSNRLVNFKFWVPSDQEVEIQAKIIQFYKENKQYAEPVMTKLNDHRLTQPTFFKSSDFMDPFQTIVETFSTPRYKEMNPAVFTIATFPCFFGMMFGDIAHGSIILIFGLYLIASYKRISESKRSILRMVTPLRYLITLMGLFAVYSGAIYGELGSVNIPLFSSCYDLSSDETKYNRTDKDCVYPFGIDWVWATTNQDVSFFNSFKMKLSIIFGVTQMLLGIVLKGSNSIFFGSMIDFFCEFIPQFVFLASSFGYMSVLIVIKWLTNWDDKKDILGDKGPPQIVGVFTSLTSVTPQLTILGNTEFQQDLQDIILSKLSLY